MINVFLSTTLFATETPYHPIDASSSNASYQVVMPLETSHASSHENLARVEAVLQAGETFIVNLPTDPSSDVIKMTRVTQLCRQFRSARQELQRSGHPVDHVSSMMDRLEDTRDQMTETMVQQVEHLRLEMVEQVGTHSQLASQKEKELQVLQERERGYIERISAMEEEIRKYKEEERRVVELLKREQLESAERIKVRSEARRIREKGFAEFEAQQARFQAEFEARQVECRARQAEREPQHTKVLAIMKAQQERKARREREAQSDSLPESPKTIAQEARSQLPAPPDSPGPSIPPPVPDGT